MLHRAVGRSALLLTLAHLALMWQDYGLADLLSARPSCFGALPPAGRRAGAGDARVLGNGLGVDSAVGGWGGEAASTPQQRRGRGERIREC